MIRINIGCGRTPTAGWLNLDNTPSLKLSKRPLVVRVLSRLGLLNRGQRENIEWNRLNNIEFCDATRPLPFESSSVDVIYSSHMVEHLSPNGRDRFFAEAKRVLIDGGILRVSVPDLQKLVREYVNDGNADKFMRRAYVSAGELSGLSDKIRVLAFGFRHHQWMYDGQSLALALKSSGFSEVFVLKAGETKVAESGDLDLFERQEESVYVEAVK